ncbi:MULTISPECIES: FMN-dependent NADH-azoreductase [unclassified Pseudomonas]|uniref:FMN-dependent NADH-azoreductase n=1 Tax=unclassified Pseudomonas TaxID=196821 RepID=UPI002AC9E853|nr:MULTISPECIES: NAD(P)H-dependent oxidoreductase [unclassified Pseudomonas]MEB0047821.1 NAD(P)H-dependent oxidoreductase [Pseudomonas sp. Dout3]MEB0098335.1 NAD(P)H-dependent oxidoreductase [Pseudomonas sp. DC1.2]WPX57122.1 NAD(P)H-dependent oxidoreductase [Pseudomonas sp. DC1.2]
MTTLLHIECSPRKQRSASLEVARSFITRYQQNAPDTEVVTLDLWNMALPELDQPAMDAKYAELAGTPITPDQQTAWDSLKALAAPLLQADVLVLSVPLWNFSIPYKLKQFIDLVSHQGILFSFDPERGLEGLLHNKTAVVAYARGLDFSAQSNTPAQQFDFQKPYVEAWLKFVGISDVYSVIVEKTILGKELDQASREAATQQAIALADSLDRPFAG